MWVKAAVVSALSLGLCQVVKLFSQDLNSSWLLSDWYCLWSHSLRQKRMQQKNNIIQYKTKNLCSEKPTVRNQLDFSVTASTNMSRCLSLEVFLEAVLCCRSNEDQLWLKAKDCICVRLFQPAKKLMREHFKRRIVSHPFFYKHFTNTAFMMIF